MSQLSYYAGVTYKNDEGIVKGTGYEKTSFRLNLDQKDHCFPRLVTEFKLCRLKSGPRIFSIMTIQAQHWAYRSFQLHHG